MKESNSYVTKEYDCRNWIHSLNQNVNYNVSPDMIRWRNREHRMKKE